MKNNLYNIPLHKSLFDEYNLYFEKSISSERITHPEILSLIINLRNQNNFRIKKLGESIEERSINLISAGSGKTKILAWTQMHGDEPTATAAVFDVLNFLNANDKFNDFRKALLSKIEIHFIPMLNPDGSERYRRENCINIDINRDAARTETPEANILMNIAKKINPEFCFNLHDQNSYYTAGRTNKTAAISLLAPPFNHNKEINIAREKSMKLISGISEMLSEYIPGHIARYNDEFEPRAFGDNFIKMGMSSVLIESGFYKGDAGKSFLRKLNFIALLFAFNSIAEKEYEINDVNKYLSIPENQSLLFDLLLKNLTLHSSNHEFKVDIGINREKYFDQRTNSFYYKGKIEQVGDLSIYYGLEEYELSGYSVFPSENINDLYSPVEIENLDFRKLHSSGITTIKTSDSSELRNFVPLPINISLKSNLVRQEIQADELANFIIKDNGIVKFIVVNGFIYNLADTKNSIYNGLVID